PKQAWLCPRFNNFGCTQHSPSKLGSALILIIMAALSIAQASLALPSFAQNLHKICALHLIHQICFLKEKNY
ncbi:MAG: hypothetical protein PF590_04915, partial [Candidatus Delongbacteria bacterium]|nr:hypothetical protein [Candidatus Delongbacteria bacterium]